MDKLLRDWVPEPLTAESAFVVHVGANGVDASNGLHGRVEHVRSGQTRRFISADELVAFMRQTLAEQS